jgi:hypothetical protein
MDFRQRKPFLRVFPMAIGQPNVFGWIKETMYGPTAKVDATY